VSSPQKERLASHRGVAASVVIWGNFVVGLQWGRNGAPGSAEGFADQTLSVVVEGLAGSVSLPAPIS